MATQELTSLPPVTDQVEHLVRLGLVAPDDPSAGRLPDLPDALVALRHDAVAAADLVARWTLHGKDGFVVEDMTDLADFVPTPETRLPGTTLYLLTGVDRGDELRSRRPSEALEDLTAAGRSPLTIHEGLSWLLQHPDALVDNHCFMTIASRRPKPRGGYDARTPALWISRGTGRDGKERRDAPKLGWCWWNNHHTWLGIASCADRVAAEA